MSTILLPEPALVASLRRLAAHDDPDVQGQATELCLSLPPPIRLIAATSLAADGHTAAAARCIWPDRPQHQERFLWALAHDLAASLRPAWTAAVPGDRRLDALLGALAAGAPPATLRAHRDALANHTVGDHKASLAAYAALALCRDTPQRAVREAMRAVSISAGEPDAAPRHAAAFLRRTLRATPQVDDALCAELAAAFAGALDDGDTERAGLLLTAGCAYHNRGQLLHGPQAILDSYARSAASARARFRAIRSESRVLSSAGHRVLVESTEHLTAARGQHCFTCHQELYFDNVGCIWRIEHHDLPGQIPAFELFMRNN